MHLLYHLRLHRSFRYSLLGLLLPLVFGIANAQTNPSSANTKTTGFETVNQTISYEQEDSNTSSESDESILPFLFFCLMFVVFAYVLNKGKGKDQGRGSSIAPGPGSGDGDGGGDGGGAD